MPSTTRVDVPAMTIAREEKSNFLASEGTDAALPSPGIEKVPVAAADSLTSFTVQSTPTAAAAAASTASVSAATADNICTNILSSVIAKAMAKGAKHTPVADEAVENTLLEDCVSCGKDRDEERFANSRLLKSSENGTRLLGPAATKINDDGFVLVLGINNSKKNCLGNNVAAEAGNGNFIEDCMNDDGPAISKDTYLKEDCMKEDEVLDKCSGLIKRKFLKNIPFNIS